MTSKIWHVTGNLVTKLDNINADYKKKNSGANDKELQEFIDASTTVCCISIPLYC